MSGLEAERIEVVGASSKLFQRIYGDGWRDAGPYMGCMRSCDPDSSDLWATGAHCVV